MAQKIVMQVLHHESSSTTKRRRTYKTIEVMDGGLMMSTPMIDIRRTARVDRNRVIVGHVEAQCAGLSELLSLEDSSYWLYVNSYGDASMWISRPPVSGSAWV